MINGENKHFDISRRTQASFKHYQILVKLFRNERTEHHNLDVFTNGPDQLLEMRRLYSKTYKSNFRSVYHCVKNN
jgi:hypothetical protein